MLLNKLTIIEQIIKPVKPKSDKYLLIAVYTFVITPLLPISVKGKIRVTLETFPFNLLNKSCTPKNVSNPESNE